MGYIEELRRLVGQRALVMVGAGVLISDAQVINVSVDYTAPYPGGEIRLNPEHSQAAFFDLANLPEPISPPLVRVIAAFCQSRADQRA